MIRFEKIILHGFKDKKRIVEFQFSKEPITMIFGANGCGKTSFLRILNAILTKDEQVLHKENIQRIDIEISENDIRSNVCIEKTEVKIDKDNTMLEFELLEHEHLIRQEYIKSINQNTGWVVINKYNWDEYDKSNISDISSILFGVNRGISKSLSISYHHIEDYFLTSRDAYEYFRRYDIRKISKSLASYLNRGQNSYHFRGESEINKKNSMLDNLDMDTVEKIIRNRYDLADRMKIERVQNALFDTLSDAIYNKEENNNEIQDIPYDFYENLISNKDKLLEILNDKRSNNRLQCNIINLLKNEDPEKIVNECKTNNLLLNLLVKMITELNKDEVILQSINKLEDIFNDHISQNKKLTVNREGVNIVFKENEENNHGINQLSSGEKHLLSFLSIFLIEGKDRDILMIDEPELSLNIKWQRNILDLLKDLAPESQIIVASHNPIIARKHSEYLVELK